MKNQYKVNKRKWAKWSTNAKRVFNTVFSSIKSDPWVFGLDGIRGNALKTVAWNTAWVAADACDETE